MAVPGSVPEPEPEPEPEQEAIVPPAVEAGLTPTGDAEGGESPDSAVRPREPTAPAQRSGKDLLKSLRVRHQLDRNMEGMREDMKKMFGQDVDDDGVMLEVLEKASSDALEAALREKRCFVSPEHRFRQIWDLVQVFLLLYVAIVIPLREGYGIPVETGSGTFWFEVFVDLYFICDIFFNFRTAIYAADGSLVLDTTQVRKSYMRSWFGLDVLACLPVTYVEMVANHLRGDDGGGSGSKVKALKILRLLRLTKMLRVARVKRIFQRYEEQLATGTMHKVFDSLRMLSYLVILVFITHIISCLWYAVGTIEEFDSEGTLTAGWIERYGLIEIEREELNATCDQECASGDWDQRRDIQPLSYQYLKSFYWSLTTLTTVGYGDVTAGTSAEMLMSCIAEMVGGVIFGMLIGVIGTSITSGRLADRKYKDKMEKIAEYMRVKQVPISLRRRIRVHYENLYKHHTVFNESEFLQKMSPQLKNETVDYIYRDIIGKVPILNGLSENVVHKICLAFEPWTAARGDVVTRDGDDADTFYIIINGELKMSVLDTACEPAEQVTVGVFGKGSFFGEEAVVLYFLKGMKPDITVKRTETAQAITDCQLAFMHRETVAKFMKDYETFRLNLLRAYHKRQNRAERILREHSSHAIRDGSVKGGALVNAKSAEARAAKRRASVVELVQRAISEDSEQVAEPTVSMEIGDRRYIGIAQGQPLVLPPEEEDSSSADADGDLAQSSAASLGKAGRDEPVVKALTSLTARMEALEKKIEGIAMKL